MVTRVTTIFRTRRTSWVFGAKKNSVASLTPTFGSSWRWPMDKWSPTSTAGRHWWIFSNVLNLKQLYVSAPRADGKGANKFREVRNQVISSILETCKLVNQMSLLQSLHDTKNCDDLLEPDSSRDAWETSKSRSSSFKGWSLFFVS